MHHCTARTATATVHCTAGRRPYGRHPTTVAMVGMAVKSVVMVYLVIPDDMTFVTIDAMTRLVGRITRLTTSHERLPAPTFLLQWSTAYLFPFFYTTSPSSPLPVASSTESTSFRPL